MIDDHFSDDMNNDEEGLITYYSYGYHYGGVIIFVSDDNGDNPDNNEEDDAVQPAPKKGLIVIFDYERDTNDEDGPAQPPWEGIVTGGWNWAKPSLTQTAQIFQWTQSSSPSS